MSGSSKNNDEINDAFAKIGLSNENVLLAHPNATVEQRLALFEGVVNGLDSIHANKLQGKDAAHATALVKINKEIDDWKQQAAEDADKIGKLQADKEEWTADKKEWTAALTQKDEALAEAEKEGKKWKKKCKKLEEKLDDYVKGEEVERERMEQRHAGELQRNVDQAVATAVEEKDKEIRSLNRKIALWKRESIETTESV